MKRTQTYATIHGEEPPLRRETAVAPRGEDAGCFAEECSPQQQDGHSSGNHTARTCKTLKLVRSAWFLAFMFSLHVGVVAVLTGRCRPRRISLWISRGRCLSRGLKETIYRECLIPFPLLTSDLRHHGFVKKPPCSACLLLEFCSRSTHRNVVDGRVLNGVRKERKRERKSALSPSDTVSVASTD